MADGLYIAVSGAKAQGDALDVLSNNIANVRTTAYRGQKVTFGEVLGNAQAASGVTGQAGYVAVTGVSEDRSQGEFVTTNNPLDLALVGDGYFSVDTARGPRYTRAGNFTLAATGTIVDQLGNPARASGGGNITIPAGAKEIQVLNDGTVVADGAEQGILELVRIAPGAATREGATLYAIAPTATTTPSTAEVRAGVLEGSNVNGVRGMVDMVKMQRTYDALLQVVESFQQVDQRTARELGGGR